MSMQLAQFRDHYLEVLLAFLWREWTALGVAGQDRRPPGHVIDPEALLLFTCSIGRYDPRLFDEVMDWLLLNGRFLNVQRLRNILLKEGYEGGPVLAAVADWLGQRTRVTKWKIVAQRARGADVAQGDLAGFRVREEPEPLHSQHARVPVEAVSLFYLPDGRVLPVLKARDDTFLRHGVLRAPLQPRGLSSIFSASAFPARLLRLRALLGVGVRCDVLNYLALNGEGYPRRMARELYCAQKSVHDVLADLECAGAVVSEKGPRERTFRLTTVGVEVTGHPIGESLWINWPALLRVCESVWRLVDRPTRHAPETAEVRDVLRPIYDGPLRVPGVSVNDSGENNDALALLETFSGHFERLSR